MKESATRWRTTAHEQFDTLLDKLDADRNAQREEENRSVAAAARNQISESLNQGLRRVRYTTRLEEAAALAVELSAPFALRCAVFLFRDGLADAVAARGLGPLPLTFSPDEGAAFRALADTKDPVVALGTESEISQALAERVGRDFTDRVFLFPLTVRQELKSILFATGSVQPAPLELISGIAAIQMEALTSPAMAARGDLVSIQGVEPLKSVPVKQAWKDLNPELQALHLRAQREARFLVAQIRLEHGEALRGGLAKSDIYGAVRAPIDDARTRFQKAFIAASPTMVDYLYLEMVRGLAQGTERLLGSEFPGPLV